ncbi:hypothetical protein AOQ72_04015 [Bradyrhizobium yuanmingense]|uniref:Uncharacterized protein n=1 Tax=Bradyrhizobium yuanmingense TaxID=108015 RepID=A0A0R3BK83_9BRAD|nr:hypothetical protein AOQ72_04015 [Bradyrhizobium yuanmingense]
MDSHSEALLAIEYGMRPGETAAILREWAGMKINASSIKTCKDMGRKNLVPQDAYEKLSDRRNIVYRLVKRYSKALCDFPKLLTGLMPPPCFLMPGSTENARDVVLAAGLDDKQKTAGRKSPGSGKYYAVG